MIFINAVSEAKRGARIRHPGMGPGWSFVWEGGRLWALNPHTGSRTDQMQDSDRARNDWEIVK